jgi:hypothetical protein
VRSTRYYVSVVVSEMPKDLVSGVLFASVCYWMMGLLPMATNFFVFVGICCMTFLVASALGNFLGAFCPGASVVGALFGAC